MSFFVQIIIMILVEMELAMLMQALVCEVIN
jgi:hypothetical protein